MVRYPSSLSVRVIEKIEYVTYPWNDGKCGGYIKIGPGVEKKPKMTTTTLVNQKSNLLYLKTKMRKKNIYNSIHYSVDVFNFNGKNTVVEWRSEDGVQIWSSHYDAKR